MTDDHDAVAMNQKAPSSGVKGPAVLLTSTSKTAEPSPGPTAEPISATGKAPGRPNGLTTITGNDDQVPGGS